MTDAPAVPATPVARREELARTLYTALAGGDADALVTLLHPDFVGTTTEGLPYGLGGTHVGAEAMARDFWWAIGQHYRARAEPDRLVALDDGGLLVLGRYTGSSRHGDAPLDAAFAHVLHFRGDRIAALAQYTDSARWAASAPPVASGRRPLRVVDHEVVDGVATIRLRRPRSGNAIDVTLVEDLYEAVFRTGADPDVRAVVLCGAGDNLTVGGDLPMFATTPGEELPARLRQMTDHYHLALERLTRLDAPVVCAARGAVAGGGMGLAHVSDIVVAAEDARFALGYAAIGLSSDGANSWFLPRLVGMRRAQELFLLNRRLTGREALEWGLVTEVVADEQVEARAFEHATRLAAGPTRAYGQMKDLLRRSWTADLPDQLAAETDTMAASGASEDARHGIAAFAAKERPRFTGR
jgi:2-(1,2-epoxy-1,2-dihydrophenyl)acetyl-CoA isomerase